MKKLKKLTAVLLSLAMTAMLSVPAFAAGEYSGRFEVYTYLGTGINSM